MLSYQAASPDGESENFNKNSTWVANYGGIDLIKFQFQELS